METLTREVTIRDIKMLKPLEEFYCDNCRRVINSREDGLVEFFHKSDDGKFTFDIRIVHKESHVDQNGKVCIATVGDQVGKFIELSKFTRRTPSTEDYPNPICRSVHTDIERNFDDFDRRLTFPYYEQARQYFRRAFADEWFNSNNIDGIYGEQTLKALIQFYHHSEFTLLSK